MGILLTILKEKEKKYIFEEELINKIIISLSFNETPEYTLYIKDENNNYYNYYNYYGIISNYPNYLYKNDKKISINLFKNIKIKYIDYNYNNNYITIEDYNDNMYKLYSNKLYIK